MSPAEPAPGRRLLHLTTTDISLELLLGPQLEAFIEAGYEVHAASAPGPFVPAIEARGVTFHPLEHSTRSMSLLSDARAAREVYRLIRELKPDIVHTHNPKPGVYGRIAAKLARTPVIVNTVHGLYAQPTDRFIKRAVVYSLERIAATCSDAELVQNVEDAALLRRLRVPESRVHVLGNGIDLSRFKPAAAARLAARTELGLGPDTVLVGAVGRLVSEKGYPELIEAFRTVRAQVPNAHLAIVGPSDLGKDDALDASTIAAAEQDGVIFLGHRDDVETLYPAMDIYVLASHREGFPRSAMEAAATGLPLVLTDIRGCRQVVDHNENGILVPVRDPQALADAMIELATQPEVRSRMGTAGLAKARAEFDQQNVIDVSLETYAALTLGAFQNLTTIQDRLMDQPTTPTGRESTSSGKGLRRVVRRALPEPVVRWLSSRRKRGTRQQGRYARAKFSDEELRHGKFKDWLGGGAAEWDVRGRFQLALMQSFGLQPSSRFLDIGCGPLRAGVHFIGFLDPHRYHGFDYNEDFIKVADSVVESSAEIQRKRPRIEAVDNFSPTLAGAGADFALAFSVLNHCTPSQRCEFFSNIGAGISPGGLLVLSHAVWFDHQANQFVDFEVERVIETASGLLPELRPSARGWSQDDEILPLLLLRRT